MDIQIASNFERLIFDLNNEDDKQTSLDMKNIKENGKYLIGEDKLNKIRENFLSARSTPSVKWKRIITQKIADAIPRPELPYAKRHIGKPIFPVFGKISGGSSLI